MIRYRELANSETRQIRRCTNQVSLRLLAKSRYAIDVRAFKKFIPSVVGPWSDKLTLQTNESVPSKPPSNVKAVSNTPSSITVSWDQIPGNGQNGVIQGYVVFYRDQSSSLWTESDVKLNSSLELTNLVTGKHYTVCVAGYTKVGRGVKSPQIQNIVVGGQRKTTKKTVMPTTRQDAVATFKPRGSFARVKAENTTLLPTEDYSEESKLRVHFNEGQGKVEEGSAGRLYDTIGCPPGNSKNALKCDVRQRCEANASPQGHIYQNVQESEHLYDTLNKFR
ncbi:unnamed protein product [Porites lobata]|uniref:Fibronectin type-III domain-containing protein n=1 Tax=Porites lobata TaxID=104759 RepID=A0ABN8P2L2_9CNID|nr:unnamed protein product [Porites lobata]